MDEPLMGTVILFAGNYAPMGWSFCEGQKLSIVQNAALYSLLGTTYGGDGQMTFALPDLRGKAPGDTSAEQLGGLHYIIAIEGSYPSRDQ
jgi:microcystin-dependent protein